MMIAQPSSYGDRNAWIGTRIEDSVLWMGLIVDVQESLRPVRFVWCSYQSAVRETLFHRCFISRAHDLDFFDEVGMLDRY